MTSKSKYFVSNSFVEKIFDNLLTNSQEFEQRVEGRVETVEENFKEILKNRAKDNKDVMKKISESDK